MCPGTSTPMDPRVQGRWPLVVIRSDGGFRAGRDEGGARAGSGGAFGIVVEIGLPNGSAYTRFRVARIGAKVPVYDSFRAEAAGVLAGVRALSELLCNAFHHAVQVARSAKEAPLGTEGTAAH